MIDQKDYHPVVYGKCCANVIVSNVAVDVAEQCGTPKIVLNEALTKLAHDPNQRGFYSSFLSGQSGIGAFHDRTFNMHLPNQRESTNNHACRTESAPGV